MHTAFDHMPARNPGIRHDVIPSGENQSIQKLKIPKRANRRVRAINRDKVRQLANINRTRACAPPSVDLV